MGHGRRSTNRSPRSTGRSTWASTSSTRPTSTATAAASGWWPSCAASGAKTIYVATKAGRRLNPHTTEGYNRENLTAFVERSLKNLGVETIDLLQLHCPPNDVYYRPEVFGVLDDLVAAGKLRYYGVSVKSPEEGLKAMDYPNVQSVQIIFNMFRQRPAELFFARGEAAAGRHPGPRAAGVRAAHRQADARATFAADDHRQFNRQGEAFDVGETFSGVDYETGLRAVEEFKAVCPPGMSSGAIRAALDSDVRRGDLRDPRRKRPEQVEENCAAADLPPLSRSDDGRRPPHLRPVRPPASASPLVRTFPSPFLSRNAAAANSQGA